MDSSGSGLYSGDSELRDYIDEIRKDLLEKGRERFSRYTFDSRPEGQNFPCPNATSVDLTKFKIKSLFEVLEGSD